MSEIVRVGRGERTASEILSDLDDGRRVIIEVELLGRTIELSIRKRESTYYCDTPMKLMRYDSRDGMRTCLERYRLAKRDGGES